MNDRILKLMLASAVCFGAAGCRHQVAPLVIPAPTPVVVSNPPVSPGPAQLPTESAGKVPLASVPVVPATPAKKTKKKAAPAPVEVASATPPPPLPVDIGSLTTGGNEAANRKAATDLLDANDRRLAGLSGKVKQKEKEHVGWVQGFQVDARKALNGGDVDGAMTLATKAKVLLDELTK